MNRELKRLSALVIVMFASLFVASSIIQVFQSDNLGSDSRNRRALADQYQVQRGQILASDGSTIAGTKKSADEFRFQRTYADGPLYAAVSGYYAIGGAPTGIEGAYNDRLSGTGGNQVFERLQSIITGQDPKGDSVQLTIDPKVQKAAYDALGNQRGAVVALDPRTGAILALVSKPSYDPGAIAAHGSSGLRAYDRLVKQNPSPLVNRATGGNLNPPGSTFKLVVSSAALESGRYSESSRFDSPTSLVLPGTTFRIQNSEGEVCGTGPKATLKTALSLSCNIPFAELGDQLGEQTIAAMAKKFGFGQTVRIPMAVTPSTYPSGMDKAQLAQSAFGQWEDRATPMQIAMVSAAIGNGGVEMQPTLVKRVLSPNLSTVEQMTPKQFSQPISAKTASAVKDMMIASVDSGAATNGRIDGVQVAGKTGTAQNGPNDPYTLWFTGFAPAQDPKVAVAVVVENGGGLGQNGYGNLVAAPVAKRVMEAVLNK
ncbi:penicillin-binding protein 2 [Amnibacterium sp. CER49]|uniref:peptidoglycan D,D-transpeptidase FtsI family protein n=1 Tax=Amnibacterium sp. CER49 TaxID=3039161 RepID=UPI0024496419|nr:penicillin-binding protein 2 [Amnibacterium sp. CER49]MDH2443602.1 penicillin-binding protein 2 [Amnibacterium sp. CER49]